MNDNEVLLKGGFQFEPIKRKVYAPKKRRGSGAKLQLFPTTDKIGKHTERRFYRLMLSLIRRESWLVRCEKTRSTVDIHEHTDFILTFMHCGNILSVAVQIKSSHTGASYFRAKFPRIPVIVAGQKVTDFGIIQQVEYLFESIFNI